MADVTYDAIIVGAGNKGLALAMYLLKYGGMSVALFEHRHEAGGGWTTDEGAAPGFLSDYHATQVSRGYHTALELDFPEWKELGCGKGGGMYNTPRVSAGAIFEEDDSCIVIHSAMSDRSQERTAKSIARFSERDAESWVKLTERHRNLVAPAFLEFLHNPPPPWGEPDALERIMMDPNSGLDPSWIMKTPLEVLRDLFESDAFIAFLMRMTHAGIPVPSDMHGMGIIVLLFGSVGAQWARGVAGGTHNFAHAAVKVIQDNGGKIFTKHEVDRVIIENGKAKGVRLTDGTEIQARKLVVSTLDPYNLCFRLIGKEHLSWQLLRRVEHLERRLVCITWYTWALREAPNYKAASSDPDINEAVFVNLINKDPEALAKEHAVRKLGKNPEELLLQVTNHSLVDKLRAPEGKFLAMTEQFVLPANAMSENEWLEFKKTHAEAVMKRWNKHAPNMTWDNVIGYMPVCPYDICHLANMAPTGNWAVIDVVPSQLGRSRPVPELARHRTPIEGLYATGSAWHPLATAASWQSYNCYKIICEDFGLRKPWEEAGRTW